MKFSKFAEIFPVLSIMCIVGALAAAIVSLMQTAAPSPYPAYGDTGRAGPTSSRSPVRERGTTTPRVEVRRPWAGLVVLAYFAIAALPMVA